MTSTQNLERPSFRVGPERGVRSGAYHFARGVSRCGPQLGLDAAGGVGFVTRCLYCPALSRRLATQCIAHHDDLQDGDRYARGKGLPSGSKYANIAYWTATFSFSMAYVDDRTGILACSGGASYDTRYPITMTISGQINDLGADETPPEEYEIIAARQSGPLLALRVKGLALAASRYAGPKYWIHVLVRA